MALRPLLILALLTPSLAIAGGPPLPAVARVTPVIWSGLVLATNDPHPAAVPSHLEKYGDKLKNVFGYNQLELIGEYAEKMDDRNERWLIPSKDFSLSVKAEDNSGGKYPMKIALFQNQRRLAQFDTRLSAESPLFIRGPQYGGGQLIIVLHVMEPDVMAVPAGLLDAIGKAQATGTARTPQPPAMATGTAAH
jgi:hypothetical protein